MVQRYVAIGDSTVEGLDDPDGRGGYRGWANRLAEKLTEVNPDLLYANLAIRGRTSEQVRAEQLEPALAMEPDLVTLVAGLNDLLRPQYSLHETMTNLQVMHTALISAGATVLTFTMPDLTPIAPVTKIVRKRLLTYNDALRVLCRRTGAKLVEIDREPICADARLWSDDRLHANSLGHERIAGALAEGLGLPGADSSWRDPLPALPTPKWQNVVAAEVAWLRNHFVPWIVRHAKGVSSGDGVTPKRPALEAVRARG
ncbi:SGNH/GDSL hydrolase family protein [Allokutzneria albata]|uniref:Lysophospholipase L1 n=1 Tax=Allokutzneria albata TaxID=211114 RepID=A0A1H0C3E1_ALLAB|nr:SGNH/GDSL hydrolase family protein [Allokutzneria albata]SDN52421.1 Lysophospholipase L1 [Allokutzneria albata]